MVKTIHEINEKIKKRKAVVLTAAEMTQLVSEKGAKAAADRVDVVTTGTFGPMCSSGMLVNVGHTKPKMKLGGGTCHLNGVPAYAGFAAVDVYLGCTQVPENDPKNSPHPGAFKYGGGHVIEEFVAGKDVRLTASSYGTDCYPRKSLDTLISIKDVNQAVLFNPRNAYQNYNVAVNASDRTIYTYMGALKPRFGNAHYCSSGLLSPLLNDPHYRTIGIGTRIFLGGGVGYVAWHGTQHNPTARRKENGVPCMPAGTLAVIGDLKQMSADWLKGASYRGYGTSLYVGVGIPIPVLDEDMAGATGVKDEDLFAQIVEYGKNYPEGVPGSLGEVSYAELKSGRIRFDGKTIPASSLSSYSKAVRIAESLKAWILNSDFLLTEPAAPIPGVESGMTFGPLKERPV
jgi:L-aspartate semialdehyde sulfurtransferase